MRKLDSVKWLVLRKLPKKWVYYCAIQLVAEVTTGKFGNTVVPELGAMDAIGRFSNLHGVK